MCHMSLEKVYLQAMSVLKEYVSVISYNFRKLRHRYNQTHEFISERSGINMQVLANLENAKICSLSTAISIALHFKVTLNDLIKERGFDPEIIYPLQKKEIIHRSLIPGELHELLFNFLANESEFIDRVSFINWVEYIDYRGRKQRNRNDKASFIQKINSLLQGESTPYAKEHHIQILDYISRNELKTFTLRRKEDRYICTKVL